MKLRLLFFAALLAFASCSGDDNTAPVDDDPIVQEPVVKNLSKFINYAAGNPNPYRITTFEDNKVYEEFTYDDEGQFVSRKRNVYNEQGAVALIEELDENGAFLSTYETFTYDQLGRLILIENFFVDGIPVYNYEFVYNDDDTISQYRIINNETSLYRTHYLDNSGKIYKIINYSPQGSVYTSEAVYEGNNIITETYNASNYIQYTYDLEHEVKGHYNKYYLNQFNNNIANIILYGGLGYCRVFSHNYLLKLQYASGASEEQFFEFDSDGYPIEVSGNFDGEYAGKVMIEYVIE